MGGYWEVEGCGGGGHSDAYQGVLGAARPLPSRVSLVSLLLVKLPEKPGGEGGGGEVDGSRCEGIGDMARVAVKHSPGAILDLVSCCLLPPLKNASRELEQSRGVHRDCGDVPHFEVILSGGLCLPFRCCRSGD